MNECYGLILIKGAVHDVSRSLGDRREENICLIKIYVYTYE